MTINDYPFELNFLVHKIFAVTTNFCGFSYYETECSILQPQVLFAKFLLPVCSYIELESLIEGFKVSLPTKIFQTMGSFSFFTSKVAK